MTIWKFPLEVIDLQVIRAPRGATPLKVMVQGGIPCLWMLVSPEAREIDIPVAIYGTGHPLRKCARKYVDSFMIDGGSLVFHVFLEETL
jgi:hypothetical protein